MIFSWKQELLSMLAYLSNRTRDCNNDPKNIKDNDNNNDNKDTTSFSQNSFIRKKSYANPEDITKQLEPTIDREVGWSG